MKLIRSLLALLVQGIYHVFLLIIYILLAVHVIVNKIINFPIGILTKINGLLVKLILYLKGEL